MNINTDVKVKPTRGQVFGRVCLSPTKTTSGLFLAKKVGREVPTRIEVKAIGSPRIDYTTGKEYPVCVAPGCIAYIKKESWEHNSIRQGNEEHFFIANDDITGWCDLEYKELHAVRDTIIIEILYSEKTGSIHIPDKFKQHSGEFRGKVIAVGPEFKDDLSPGDLIPFRRHEGSRIDFNQKEYICLKNRWAESKIVE